MANRRFSLSRGLRIAFGIAVGLALTSPGGRALPGQDKYALSVPNGLSFSDFRGYENWQVVAVSQTDELLKVMVANPTMIDAYRAGVPGSGKPFPDGSNIAKIEWKPKTNVESPFPVRVPDTLQDVFFIEKNVRLPVQSNPRARNPRAVQTPLCVTTMTRWASVAARISCTARTARS